MCIALVFLVKGNGYFLRRLLLSSMMFAADFWIMYRWLRQQRHRRRESQLWSLWHQSLSRQSRMLPICSFPMRLFFVYAMIAVQNIFVFSLPLSLACRNMARRLLPMEYAAAAVWTAAFVLLVLANLQLDRMRASRDDRVVRSGLWRISRHPDTFAETAQLLSYALFGIASASSDVDYYSLLAIPVVLTVSLISSAGTSAASAALFVAAGGRGLCLTTREMHIAGIRLVEEAAIAKFGDMYRTYQREVPVFFPWSAQRNRRALALAAAHMEHTDPPDGRVGSRRNCATKPSGQTAKRSCALHLPPPRPPPHLHRRLRRRRHRRWRITASTDAQACATNWVG